MCMYNCSSVIVIPDNKPKRCWVIKDVTPDGKVMSYFQIGVENKIGKIMNTGYSLNYFIGIDVIRKGMYHAFKRKKDAIEYLKYRIRIFRDSCGEIFYANGSGYSVSGKISGISGANDVDCIGFTKLLIIKKVSNRKKLIEEINEESKFPLSDRHK